MTDTSLTPDRILDATEQVLRRFGPDKATVVDVARALDVSHGSIYRHFPSKAALRDAVAERWLHRVAAPLEAIAAADGLADAKLRRWLEELIAQKRRKVRDDPEMFATYVALAQESRGAVDRHVAELLGQIRAIIDAGCADAVFFVADAAAAARAVFQATARFHHPAHAAEWDDPQIDRDFEAVWHLVLAGLKGGAA
ncbi:MAG: TetR family transcriptional regulator [Rhodospirillaceae bacterium]|nr:TetR family transcriptional regulator [Rhodospirillaceae bacterium]